MSIIFFPLTFFSPMQAASFLATLFAIFPFSPGLASPRSTAPDNIEVGSQSASAITPEISVLAESLIAADRVPGISVGVVRLNGSSVITEYGAWGNRTEDGDLADSQVNYGGTLFYSLNVSHCLSQMITNLGSCSKAFLTSAIGILIDDFATGRNVTALPDGVDNLTWDTKIQDLFPGDSVWKLEDQWATEKANVADILSMATGVTRYGQSTILRRSFDHSWISSNQFIYTRDDTPVTLAQRFRYIKPGFELRERWEYTNIVCCLCDVDSCPRARPLLTTLPSLVLFFRCSNCHCLLRKDLPGIRQGAHLRPP